MHTGNVFRGLDVGLKKKARKFRKKQDTFEPT